MPCDHTNLVVEENSNSLIYKRNLCVHQTYWDSVGGDIKNYYILREELIKGLLESSNIRFKTLEEGKYQLEVK